MTAEDDKIVSPRLGGSKRRSTGGQRSARAAAYQAKVQEALGMPQQGDIIADKYKVSEVLGVGGMGAVFAATHLLTGKRVALKWLLPGVDELEGAEERLLREAKATARIDHANVVNVFDVGRHASGLFLVMEKLTGESLAECLERSRVGVTTGIAMLLPALRGVMAAHNAGVVHRDLKPDNLFLCCDKAGDYIDSKVLDFGISKLLTSEEAALTATGAMLGTPWYMAPEQVRGAKTVDARADIYALGVILYELIGDGYPFEADSMGSLMFKIVMDTPRPLRELAGDVNPQLAAVVEKAMAKDPAARFADVEELALALEPFAGGATYSRASVLSVDRLSDSTPLPNRAQLTESQVKRNSSVDSQSGRAVLSAFDQVEERSRPSTPSGDDSKGFTIIGQPTPSSMPVAVELAVRPARQSGTLRAAIGAAVFVVCAVGGIWAMGGVEAGQSAAEQGGAPPPRASASAPSRLTGSASVVASEIETPPKPASALTIGVPLPNARGLVAGAQLAEDDGLAAPQIGVVRGKRAKRPRHRRVRRSRTVARNAARGKSEIPQASQEPENSAKRPAPEANRVGLREDWDDLVQPSSPKRRLRKPHAGAISKDDF